MRLLVSGGAGFLGSHFIRRWMRTHPSDQIVNLDLLTYAGSRARLADLETHPQYTFVEGNICDPALVRQAMDGCDAVIHLAAETHVDRSIADAAPFLRTNVEGTHVLLEAARALRVKRFLHVSTDEIYGPIVDGAVDEQAPMRPCSPYAASKAAGDLLAQAFHHTYQLPVLIARPTNIYGSAQLPEKLIPLCITNALDSLTIPIYGDGEQRRAWLFVSDLCDALQAILERGTLGQIYNIAGGHEQANMETVRQILKALGCAPALMQFVADRPGHDRRYAMHDAMLRQLGWRPQVSFEDGVKETIEWYREHHAWWRPLAQRLREDSYHWLNRSARSSAPQASGAIV